MGVFAYESTAFFGKSYHMRYSEDVRKDSDIERMLSISMLLKYSIHLSMLLFVVFRVGVKLQLSTVLKVFNSVGQ